MLILLVLSLSGASPALAACSKNAAECSAPPYTVSAEPVWGTLNTVTGGNYPGGSLQFGVFVINAGYPAEGNATLFNETITAAALPPALNTSTAKGLPVLLTPGQAITSTITMQIPRNFTLSSFKVSLAVDVSYWNGTANIPVQLMGSATVYVLGDPIGGASTTSSQTTQTTQTSAQSGTVSTTLFAAGLAIPSILAVILLILVVRRRGGPKGGT